MRLSPYREISCKQAVCNSVPERVLRLLSSLEAAKVQNVVVRFGSDESFTANQPGKLVISYSSLLIVYPILHIVLKVDLS